MADVLFRIKTATHLHAEFPDFACGFHFLDELRPAEKLPPPAATDPATRQQVTVLMCKTKFGADWHPSTSSPFVLLAPDYIWTNTSDQNRRIVGARRRTGPLHEQKESEVYEFSFPLLRYGFG